MAEVKILPSTDPFLKELIKYVNHNGNARISNNLLPIPHFPLADGLNFMISSATAILPSSINKGNILGTIQRYGICLRRHL